MSEWIEITNEAIDITRLAVSLYMSEWIEMNLA